MTYVCIQDNLKKTEKLAMREIYTQSSHRISDHTPGHMSPRSCTHCQLHPEERVAVNPRVISSLPPRKRFGGISSALKKATKDAEICLVKECDDEIGVTVGDVEVVGRGQIGAAECYRGANAGELMRGSLMREKTESSKPWYFIRELEY